MKITDFFRRHLHRAPARHGKIAEQLHFLNKKIKCSIAFKTTMVYIVVFGFVLVIAAWVTSSAFASYSAHSAEIDRTASFVVSRIEAPQSKSFDFAEFAQYSKTYIEITDMRTMQVRQYGTSPQNMGTQLQAVRRVERPDRHLMVKVVSIEYTAEPFRGGVGLAFTAVLIILLVFAGLAGSLSMNRLLRPVSVMTQTARSITANDLSVRIEEGSSEDELNELARTFNEMLDRIEEAYRQQNRFVSDASHELRTPLSVISGYANLLRRWGTQNQAVLEESVEKIIEETDNMQQLVERLLFLARIDQKTQAIHPERFDVGALMQQIAKETRLIDSNHTLCEQVQPQVFLTADKAFIQQAIRAMVENSMKYTPAGGTITLSCKAEEDKVLLLVKDTGIGIAEKDLHYIFDRFYKADEARSRKAGGTGLGLSIVKWIVERHGGAVSVTSVPEQGTEFCITLFQQKQ